MNFLEALGNLGSNSWRQVLARQSGSMAISFKQPRCLKGILGGGLFGGLFCISLQSHIPPISLFNCLKEGVNSQLLVVAQGGDYVHL